MFYYSSSFINEGWHRTYDKVEERLPGIDQSNHAFNLSTDLLEKTLARRNFIRIFLGSALLLNLSLIVTKFLGYEFYFPLPFNSFILLIGIFLYIPIVQVPIASVWKDIKEKLSRDELKISNFDWLEFELSDRGDGYEAELKNLLEDVANRLRRKAKI